VARLHGSIDVSRDTGFRTPEQEVLKFLEECAEIRQALKTISAQVGRMETRAKRAFPAVAVAKPARERKVAGANSAKASISSEQALVEFDRIVGLAASGSNKEAESILEAKSAPDLRAIAKELGVSFAKSKPSVKALREAIFGKVRESVLLTRHSTRG
jgi:hypothetical protein